MKTKQLLLICITFFIASLFSCQKDFTAPDNALRTDSTIVVGGDSNYLDKIFVYDTTFLGGTFQIDSSVRTFSYDNYKRLKSVRDKSEFLTTNPGDLYLDFFYNSIDSLPYKVFYYPDSISFYLYYDNQGRLIKDSIVNAFGLGSNGIINLNYSANKVYAKQYNLTNLNLPIEKDTFTLDLRGNIIDRKTYVNTIGSTFELLSTRVATFDIKKSPFSKMPSYKVFSFSIGTFISDSYFNDFGENNLVIELFNQFQITGTSPPSNPFTVKSLINSYNTNGYLKNLKDGSSLAKYIYKPL